MSVARWSTRLLPALALAGCALGGAPGRPAVGPSAAPGVAASAAVPATACPIGAGPRTYARVGRSAAGVAGSLIMTRHPQGGVVVCDNAQGVVRIRPDGTKAVLAAPAGGVEMESIDFEAPTGYPLAAAVAPDGTLFVVNLKRKLSEIAPGGKVVRSTVIAHDLRPVLGVAGDGRPVFARNPDPVGGGDGCALVRWEADGTTTVLAGRADLAGGLRDGTGAEARFMRIAAIDVDGAGNLYVADAGNGAIRRVTPAGVVTTVFANPYPSPLPSVPGRSMPDPQVADRSIGGVTLGPGGELFYTGGDWRVHRITAAGVDQVLAGTGHVCAQAMACAGSCPSVAPETCSVDGPPAEAEFDGPAQIACDPDGKLWVFDGPRAGRNATLRTIE